MKHEFTCNVCKLTKSHTSDSTTGYGVDKDNNKVCFQCCGDQDKKDMIKHGNAMLYMTKKDGKYIITNWLNTLKFECPVYWANGHNWGLTRHNVRFKGPDNKIWYGVTFGDNTQIAHCKRTKLTDIRA